ncbi:hypothetical protein [Alistipes sp.]|uniref:hypothetical protein n=1 Tax=Alistipes sp. TaxID=1872444 RepID=UPI003AB90A17
MTTYLILLLSAFLPSLGFGQIEAKIDSIDFSQFIEIPDHNMSTIIEEIPAIILKVTITNNTNEKISLIRTVYPYFGMSWIEFEQDDIMYYITAEWLDTRPRELSENSPPMPPGDVSLAPNESTTLTYWCNSPRPYGDYTNRFLCVTPVWDYKDINYRQWFNEVYKSIRLVLLYNLDTGQPSVLVSQPVDKKTIITGNMRDKTSS